MLRVTLTPGFKLAVTLRHLALRDIYHSLMYAFQVPHNTISILVREVCEVIVAVYAEEVIPTPTTPEAWRTVTEGLRDSWQIPHCIGALDGKHVAINCPDKGGSVYYNGFRSIILMALVDYDYKLL